MHICKKSSIFAPDLNFIYMKKLFSIVLLVCFALGMYAETVFTFTTASDMNQTKDGITVVIATGSGSTAPAVKTDYETQKPEMRLYSGNTITVSSESALTDIQMVFAKSSASNKNYAGLSTNAGKLEDGGTSTSKTDWKTDHWTGEATSVVFTLTGSGQRQIKQIVIGGEPIDIDPVEDVLPTAEDLVADYTYAEPTLVQVPDTQIFKKEYAFISNNILVHCTKGSIVFASEDEATYFGCNAGEQLTFTATQPMARIEINGNVRKLFSASSDKGVIWYASDPEQETAADPVLKVSEINAKEVTINCDKNLSCYGMQVYFEDATEAIERTSALPSASKILRNGQLLILRNDRVYTVNGSEVQ